MIQCDLDFNSRKLEPATCTLTILPRQETYICLQTYKYRSFFTDKKTGIEGGTEQEQEFLMNHFYMNLKGQVADESGFSIGTDDEFDVKIKCI